MNCDQAFDSMTDNRLRGSSELHAHFATCPRCRDLADVLEPALGLFEQSDDVDNAPNWPIESASTYDAAAQRVPQPRLQSAPWLNAQRHQQRRIARRDGAKVAIIMLFIAALTAAFANVGRVERRAELLASAEPCIRAAKIEQHTANTMVAQCVSCHVDLVQLAKLENRQQAESDRLITQCVTCHLKPTSDRGVGPDPELLQACLFPVTKS